MQVEDSISSACNFVSTGIFLTKELKQKALHNSLYTEIRSRFKLGSQMACSVLTSTTAHYKSAKPNGHDRSKIEFKHPGLDLVWNRDYSITQNEFSVNTLNGRIKVSYQNKAMEKYFDGSWQFGTAKLVKPESLDEGC